MVLSMFRVQVEMVVTVTMVEMVLMQQVRQSFIQSFLEEVQVVQQLSLLVVQQQTILTT